MTRASPVPNLAAELQELRARLAEAEEALRAIRSGDVDAVMVTGEHGEQVYTLRGADRVYRQLIETMSEGALTLSGDGVILYCNTCFATMLGRPTDQVRGSALRNHVSRAEQRVLDAMLAQARTKPSHRDINLRNSDGHDVAVYLSVSHLQQAGAEPAFCIVVTNLTEKRRHEQMVADERLARLILEQAAEAIIVCDEPGKVVRLSTVAVGLCDGNPLQRDFSSAFPLRLADGASFDLAPVLLGERLRNVDAVLDRHGKKLDFIVNAGPLSRGQEILGCVITLTNVTEHRRTEAALVREGHRNQVFLRNASDGVHILDADGNVLECSDSFCEMLGYSRDDLIGANVTLWDAMWSPQELKQRLAALVAQDGRMVFETRHRRRDGSVFDVEVSGQSLELDGSPALFTSSRDITLRKQADAALRQSELLSRSLVEHLPQRIFVKDRRSVYRFASARYAADLGIAPEEIVGKDDFAFFPTDLAEQYRADDQAVMAAGTIRHIDEKYLHEGMTRWIHTIKVPHRDALGEIDGVLGIFEDTTERRAMDEQRDRFAALVEASSDFIGFADPKTMHVSYINRRGRAMCGLGEDEDVSQLSINDLYPASMHQFLLDDVVPAIERDGQWTGDGALRHRDGREIPVSMAMLGRKASNGKIDLYYTVSRDITERRQAEETRRHREAELEESQRIARVGSWEWTLATGVIEWSDGLNRILGRDHGSPPPTFEQLPAFYSPETWQQLSAVIGSAVEAGVPYDIELEMIRADGTRFWTTTRGEAVRGPDGSVVKLRGTVLDISERKRAEEARTRREAELQESQRIARIGSWEWILDTGVIRWSEGMNHLLARDRGSPPPTVDTLSQFYTPESWQRLGVVMAKAVETGASYDLDVEMIRADGTRCRTTVRGEAVRGDGGTVVKLRGTVLDISERRRAEGILQMQAAALNATANPIVITDATGTVTWANAAFSATSGYELSETVGRNLRTLIKSGAQDAAFYQKMWATILAGEVWQGELINRRKDGSLYPEAMTITSVRDAGGTISHFIAVKRDLTDERKLQAEFHQAQKMESVGRLAGGVAHDFNNLLTVILSYAKFIEEDLPPDDPRHEDVQQILSAGESAADLTGRLLAFSRREILEPKVLLLNTVASATEGMLRRVVREDITLRMVLDPDLRPIMADRGQMEQVIMNLAVNARDAMPGGGTLTIETANVAADAVPIGEAGVPTGGDYVLLRVRDTGVGMDEATRRHVFEPFFTTKEWGKGTGLGLSTVHGIVRASAGQIQLQSEPGVGTTFSIYLPAVGPTGKPDPLPRAQPTQLRGTETVLVVEDAAPIRTAVCTVLQRNGYTVLVASDGEAALERAAEHHGPIHLLLTDVVMPGMNGRQLADQLRGLRPECRVLYMSGYAHDMISEQGMLGPGIALLHKPFTPGPLAMKVREVLDAG